MTKKPFDDSLSELKQRRDSALQMGGAEKLEKRKDEGHLNARERIDHLFDEGSFNELGMLARSARAEARHKTPADGKVTGFGKIDDRWAGIISNDFTVMGASSALINGKKMRHIKELATKRGSPLIFLGESSGSRMPDRMGAQGRSILGQDPIEYRRLRETPWAAALLGDCYGSSTWYGCMSDFVVMRKGSTMAVASSRVTSLAINQPIDKEDLGGWKLLTGTSGVVDLAGETDEQALDAIKSADGLVIAPSNPIVSIGPILAIPGVTEAVVARRDRNVAVSPIVGGAALKGPADRMLRELGEESSVVGVARRYRDLAATLVIDEVDADLASDVEAAGMHALVMPTIMSEPGVAAALATACAEACR